MVILHSNAWPNTTPPEGTGKMVDLVIAAQAHQVWYTYTLSVYVGGGSTLPSPWILAIPVAKTWNLKKIFIRKKTNTIHIYAYALSEKWK